MKIIHVLTKSIKVRTTGGTGDGAICEFPFTHNNIEYTNACAERKLVNNSTGLISIVKFCSTG